ncbi:patatin-like phospholipase family protein [Saccharopolyspora sp. CA-218241]|uniref:patatin-like phospholipase family protein n=1 Tax=Saccharopolyspora sp. CA-218241 TaxID=3240027 RepID=UPI003D967960
MSNRKDHGMRTAWVLPGGSTFGAIQAGLVGALFEAGIEPDVLVGTSVGSLNAAWLAGDPSHGGAASLRSVWLSMRRNHVFPIQPSRILAGKLGLSNHVMSNHGLAKWLHGKLPFRRLDEARVPLTVATTDLDTGDPVYFDSGPALPPLVASCSIPGMFPPVRIGQRWLVDGGPAAFMPVSRAVEQGAERVFVLPCGGTEPFEAPKPRRGIGAIATWPTPATPPRSVGGVNGAALGAAMAANARLDLQLNAQRCELYVLPAPSVIGLSPYTFEHAAALIDASFEIARAWLPGARPVPTGPVDIGGRPDPSGEFGVEAAAR